ncbi:DUF2029 domain-containing protein [Patescibacteria group bacterium]|nr:DUF2029 domain-containing protein [Patescibacteria group bacterium]
MSLDVLGILFASAVFLVINRWGLGILHTETFLAGLTLVSICYLMVSMLRPARSLRLRLLLTIAFAVLATVIPTISNMQERHRTLPQNFVNDSAMQAEIAGRYLLLGLNPYSTPYDKSDLAKWPYIDEMGNKTNPALFNNIHPPFLLLVSAAQYRVFAQLFAWSDIRVVYLLAYASLFVLAFWKFGISEKTLLFLIFGALNPLLTTFIPEGTNDVMVLALLLWALFAAEKKSFIVSGILLGLAMGTKQTAWVAAPFFAYWLWKQQPAKAFRQFLLSTILTAGAIYLPFLVWHAEALIKSLVLYVTTDPRAQKFIHPIEGIGFSPVLPKLGVVKSLYSTFPFWIIQIIAYTVSFLLYWVHTKRGSKEEKNVLFFMAFGTLMAWYFSRYFLQSHLGYIITLFTFSYFWDQKKIS